MATVRKKVLWIDDEIEFLRSHIMFLETRGYSVSPVFSGDDAIEMLNVSPTGFDIVLLDEQMPGMGGLETLENIKKINPKLPVVMVTKSEEETLMEQAIGKKIDGYLTKPVNPSQILSVCKKILHTQEIISSQLKEAFLRSYSVMKSALSINMNHKEWFRIYRSISRWELRLESISDEGIRQALNGLRSDAEALFSNYIFSRYLKWLQGIETKPSLSWDVMDTYINPVINAGENVVMIVLNSMRYDQYLAIKHLLLKNFSLSENIFFSVLPSSPEYSSTSLFSGKKPREVAEEYSKEWSKLTAKGLDQCSLEEKGFIDKARAMGLSKSECVFFRIDKKSIGKSIKKVKKLNGKRLVALVGDIFELLPSEVGENMHDQAHDEISFRHSFFTWFENSPIYSMLQDLAKRDYKVILTSANGSNYCTRGVEAYGKPDNLKTFRYHKGANVTCDERYAFFVHEPEMFALPSANEKEKYVILKENFHFTGHDVYENYNKNYMKIFEHGGISMKEMMMPLIIMESESDEFL